MSLLVLGEEPLLAARFEDPTLAGLEVQAAVDAGATGAAAETDGELVGYRQAAGKLYELRESEVARRSSRCTPSKASSAASMSAV